MNLPRRLRGELPTQRLRLMLMPRLVLDSVVSATEVSATVDLVGSMVASGDTDMEDTDCTEEGCMAEVSTVDMVCGRSEAEQPNTSLYLIVFSSIIKVRC